MDSFWHGLIPPEKAQYQDKFQKQRAEYERFRKQYFKAEEAV